MLEGPAASLGQQQGAWQGEWVRGRAERGSEVAGGVAVPSNAWRVGGQQSLTWGVAVFQGSLCHHKRALWRVAGEAQVSCVQLLVQILKGGGLGANFCLL